MSRRAIFKLDAGPLSARPFDGQQKATVIVEEDGRHTLLRVRPHARKEEAVASLADVAEWVLWRHAKAKAAAKVSGGRR